MIYYKNLIKYYSDDSQNCKEISLCLINSSKTKYGTTPIFLNQKIRRRAHLRSIALLYQESILILRNFIFSFKILMKTIFL